MDDLRSASAQANQVATVVGRVLLGVPLVVLGATNFFYNVFLINRDVLPLFDPQKAGDSFPNRWWIILTAAALTGLFTFVPLISGMWLVMSTGRSRAPLKSADSKT